MTNPALKGALRSSLETVEQSAEPGKDDAAVSGLKQTIVRTVAELDKKIDEKDKPEVAPHYRLLRSLVSAILNRNIGDQ